MKTGSKFLVALLFVAGLAVLLYPTASNWLASRNHSRAILEYSLTVEALSAQEIEAKLDDARQYNRLLDRSEIGDLFGEEANAAVSEQYLSTLNLDGIIGAVEIPSISVSLPIYHTVDAEVLRRGVGHLPSSALPVGGEGGHPVLTAHRGLPSAKLFTDLNRVEVGDMFYVHVLDLILAYEVDQVLVVEPHETEALQPVEGKDYVTLITCTPYAINSHRLLVRGIAAGVEQKDFAGSTQTTAVEEQSPVYTLLLGISGALILGGAAAIWWQLRKRRR